ncbi:MAG: hypothetical protein ACTSX4_07155 [Candidatus Helarchaeota archaeon]
MIKNIYILKDDGTFLYTHDFVQETIDKQILLGFIMSTVHFSKEAFSGIIRRIEVPDGQLVIFREPYTKIIISALSSPQDDMELIQKVLELVFDSFLEMFGKKIDSENFIEESSSFDSTLKDLISHKTKKRNIIQILIGLGLALILLIPLSILAQLILTNLFEGLFSKFLTGGSIIIKNIDVLFLQFMAGGLLLFLIYGFLMIPLPCFVIGYFSGTKKRGVALSLIFLVIMNVIFMFIRNDFFNITTSLTIVNLPIVIMLALVSGLAGGWTMEKRNLFG